MKKIEKLNIDVKFVSNPEIKENDFAFKDFFKKMKKKEVQNSGQIASTVEILNVSNKGIE